MNRKPPIWLFIVAVVGIGLAIGFFTAPAEWYAALQKPSFNPPNWLFGPVWTALYVLIAIAGWRVWSFDRLRMLWLVQMVLNFAWSPAFFGLHSIIFALVIIIALLATILAFILRGWNVDRTAALMFVPYAAWVGFATLLNAAILVLN